MNKHTPGPWLKDPYPNERGYSIRAGGKVRAVVMHRDGDILRDDVPEGQANAHLIAAAPDLLAAVKAHLLARDALENVHVPNLAINDQRFADIEITLESLKTAVAKAEGRA